MNYDGWGLSHGNYCLLDHGNIKRKCLVLGALVAFEKKNDIAHVHFSTLVSACGIHFHVIIRRLSSRKIPWIVSFLMPDSACKSHSARCLTFYVMLIVELTALAQVSTYKCHTSWCTFLFCGI